MLVSEVADDLKDGARQFQKVAQNIEHKEETRLEFRASKFTSFNLGQVVSPDCEKFGSMSEHISAQSAQNMKSAKSHRL